MEALIALIVMALTGWWIFNAIKQKAQSGHRAGNHVAGSCRRSEVFDQEVFDRSFAIEEMGDGALSLSLGDTFFVEASRSPNGRFVVGSSDAHIDGTGAQERIVEGQVALVDTAANRICWQVRIRRPNYPKVSDNGVVVVESWKDWNAKKPGGGLIAFVSSGEQLWEKRFQANVHGASINAHGTVAIVRTYNSQYKPHSNKFFGFRVADGEALWKVDAIGDYTFRRDYLVVDGRVFHLQPNGQLPAEYEAFVDEKEAEVQTGFEANPFNSLPVVSKILRADGDLNEAERLLQIIQDSPILKKYPKQGALYFRYLGELRECQGKLEEALQHWDRALELDPKVGIAKRAALLSKKLHRV